MDAPKADEHTSDDTSKDMLITSPTALLYKTILVPHDGSTMVDIALKHAIYLSNLSGAEIIILNVLEHVDSVDSSAVLITSRQGNEIRDNYEIRLGRGSKKYGRRKNMQASWTYTSQYDWNRCVLRYVDSSRDSKLSYNQFC